MQLVLNISQLCECRVDVGFEMVVNHWTFSIQLQLAWLRVYPNIFRNREGKLAPPTVTCGDEKPMLHMTFSSLRLFSMFSYMCWGVAPGLRARHQVDYVMIFVGTICAAGAGAVMPTFSIIFGDILDAFHEDNASSKVRSRGHGLLAGWLFGSSEVIYIYIYWVSNH